MTDAQKCCAVLDYEGFEAHNLDGSVWITVWHRELTHTGEFELSRDEIVGRAKDYDQYCLLSESFRKWLEESQTLVRLVPENKDND